jgi:hypothetical protein
MPPGNFDRDGMARWYATRHLRTDPGIKRVYYLPANAPDREIRFLEVNDLIAERDADPFEPIDFGVDTGTDTAHTLVVVDVTPAQWEKIQSNVIKLPEDWSLDSAIVFSE